MKRKLFNMTGVLAVLLPALGLVLAGCPTDSDDGSGGGGKTFPAAKGKLTINNIPVEYEGKYVYVDGRIVEGEIINGRFDYTRLVGLISITHAYGNMTWSTVDDVLQLVKIEGGKAVVPLYLTGMSVPYQYRAYEGNDTLHNVYDDVNGYVNDYVTIWIYDDGADTSFGKNELADDGFITMDGNGDKKIDSQTIRSGTFSKGNLTYNWRK
jgi:hypothetical protein